MSKSPSADGQSLATEESWYEDRWRQSRWRSVVRRRLLEWFAQNAREMPWRSDPTPYRVWVSEVMLQQTQVATVLPYFERFLTSFPTIEALAEAPEQALMTHWEGLGYYRRARSLHAAAKQIVEKHDGVFPTTYEEVIQLPGIGRYTAGAILSIACGQKLPILEGNTQRVFARWIGMRKPVTDKEAIKLLWEVAEAMLPRNGTHHGIFNQAAMEIGALLCTPKQPKCDECPLRAQCVAHRMGAESEIPGKVKKIKYESRTEFAFLIKQRQAAASEKTTRYLMRPLPEKVRWAGLWDFPRTIDRSMKDVEDAADEVSRAIGVVVDPGEELAKIRHAVTKYRIELRAHYASVGSDDQSFPAPWRFVSVREMKELPLSVTGRKIANLLAKQKP